MHHHVAVNGTSAQALCVVYPVRCGRAKESSAGVAAMPGGIKIFFQELDRSRMRRNVTNLRSFAVNTKMFHAPALRVILDPQKAKLRPPNGVKEEHGENCAV